MLFCGRQLSVTKESCWFLQWYHICSSNCFNSTFLCRSQEPGWEFPEGMRPQGWGATHGQNGTHSKCTTFQTKCHFSCPRGILYLCPVPCINELFLLHFPMVYLPLLSPLCQPGCSSALPASGGLGMVIFRSFNLVTCLVLGSTQQQQSKKIKYIIKLISQMI